MSPRLDDLFVPFVRTLSYSVWFRDKTRERAAGQWRLWSKDHIEQHHAEEAAKECLTGREWAETRIARDTHLVEWLEEEGLLDEQQS